MKSLGQLPLFLITFLLFTVSYAEPSVGINKTVKAIQSQAPDINPQALKLALNAYQKADKQGLVKKPVLTIVDYEKASSQKRLWVIDLAKKVVTFHTYVAHGKNSGGNIPNQFSNVVDSKASSIGTFITANAYTGSRGYAMRLLGLEKGFNDNALKRAVVVHGAAYADAAFVKRVGRLGRSWGCPAIATKLAKPIIDTIKDGSVFFAYYPSKEYLQKSRFV